MLISTLCILCVLHRFGEAKKKAWIWTTWLECKDKNACEYEMKRYCEGDPTGEECGEAPHSQSLYYKSLHGCTNFPNDCETWSTRHRTNCDNDACDFVIQKECDTISSCFLTYLYTCNSELYIDCVGQWSQWKVKPTCKDKSNKIANITLRRECRYEGKPSVKCGGNFEMNSFQEKIDSSNINNATCDHENFNSTAVFSTMSTSITDVSTTQPSISTTSSTTLILIIFAIAGVLLITFLGGWLIKKHIRKKEQGVSVDNVLYRNSEVTEPPDTHVATNENKYEEPTATRKCDEIASMASETDYHIYEELLPKNEYENTRHDTSQDLLPNSLDYVNPKCIPNRLLYENDGRIQINNNLRRQQYENINQQTNEAPSPLLDDENGYLMSVMPKNSNMIPIDSYGYMEIEENNTKRDPSES